jgi:hypothetical protein
MTHASYKLILRMTAGEEVSSQTASRDLRAMVDAGLLAAVGQTRGRHYVADPSIIDARRAIAATREPRETNDPFEPASRRLKLAHS